MDCGNPISITIPDVSRVARTRSKRPPSRRFTCRLGLSSTCVARSHLHEVGTFAFLFCRVSPSQLFYATYPDSIPEDKTLLCTQVSCTGGDVGAKFTSDQPHAVMTRCDWRFQLYLAYLSTTPLRHMPRVLAIHRSMTKNDIARRRVRY